MFQYAGMAVQWHMGEKSLGTERTQQSLTIRHNNPFHMSLYANRCQDRIHHKRKWVKPRLLSHETFYPLFKKGEILFYIVLSLCFVVPDETRMTSTC